MPAASVSDTAAVAVVPLDPGRIGDARALAVRPWQRRWVGEVIAHAHPDCDDARLGPMLVTVDGAAAGFYRLERGAAFAGTGEAGVAAVGIRAFLLDQRWQGRGLALPAVRAACADIGARLPDARCVVLHVHCANLRALAVYRAAGFVAAARPVPGGEAGPQWLMWRASAAGAAAAVGESRR